MISPNQAAYAGKLAVVLPAYNEELNVALTLEGIFTKASLLATEVIVVCVNDGSRDGTKAVLEGLRQQYPRLQVVNNVVNLGYGGALKAGFAAAKTQSPDAIFFMDSDGQFDIADLVKMLPLLADWDGVFGYRQTRQDHVMRKLNAKAWGMFVRLLFGIRIRDIDCAFKVFRADFFQDLNLISNGAMINTELLARFVDDHRKAIEVEVRHLPRQFGSPTGANLGVIVRAFWEAAKLRIRLWQQSSSRDTN